MSAMIRRHLTLALALVCWAVAADANARTQLKTICRVKGQEENTLQGLGFVVGLKGTGDGGNFLPTIRSLAKAMTVMGEPLGSKDGLNELKNAKNVALVTVTATVPASGARQGDRIDCVVSSIGSAKDLSGGRLFLTPLIGPDRSNPRVYAFAQGPVRIENAQMPTTGRITAGCQLEAEFFNAFAKDGKMTLVLDPNYADFQVAQNIADLINTQMGPGSVGVDLAKALDQVNVEVVIPTQYREDPVMFVAMVLSLPVMDPPTGARVVVNERTGLIVMGGDVEIGPAVVSHKNIVIETDAPPAGGNAFVPLDSRDPEAPKLKALVESLNALHVPSEDIIEIVKALDRDGKLHGQLILQ